MEGRDWRFRVLGFAVLLLAGRPAHPADPPPLLCPGRLAYGGLISPLLRGRRSARTPVPCRLRAMARRSPRVFSLAASADRRSCVPGHCRRDVGGLGGVWEG
jgi:hypothetical protein